MFDWVPNPLDAIGGLIGGAASAAANGVLELILNFWYGMIADAVATVTGYLIQALDSTTRVSLTSGWWVSAEAQAVWRNVLGISAGLLLLFYLLQTFKSIATGDTAGLLRTVVVTLPMVVLSTVALVAITSVILTITDEATTMVTGDLGTNLGEFSTLMGTPEALASGGLLGLIFAIVYILGALFIWIQLVIRASLIYVLVMFAPLTFAARVFDSSRHVSRRVIEIGLALILSKFAIGLTLATGAAAVAGANAAPKADGAVDYTALIAGPSIMILGAFMPSVLYRLIPVFEGATVAQGIASGPIRAISTVGGLAFAGASIARLAGGGAGAAAGAGAASGGAMTAGAAAGPIGAAAAGASKVGSTALRSAASAVSAISPSSSSGTGPSSPGGTHTPP